MGGMDGIRRTRATKKDKQERGSPPSRRLRTFGQGPEGTYSWYICTQMKKCQS